MQEPMFDHAQIHNALTMAQEAINADQLVDNGLTPLAQRSGRDPLAWVDSLYQVWPHEPGALTHAGIQYLYTREEVLAAMQASQGIITVSTMPSHVVPQVTGEAPPPAQPEATPDAAAKAGKARVALLTAFANPAGIGPRVE